MADLQQFFTKSLSSSTKLNRRIMYGPSNELWPVPQGTTEVEVHVWGGGGSSCTLSSPAYHSGGGGGGGYARARYSVTSTDCLCITVGGNGGTSSITIPTQSPTSPVSATGGGNATCVPGSPCGTVTGGVGGIGTYTLGPVHPTVYSFTACGGNGGSSGLCPENASGGGAAGSPKGDGGWGGRSHLSIGFPFPATFAGAGGGSIGFGTGGGYLFDLIGTPCKLSSVCGGSSTSNNQVTSPGCSFNYCDGVSPTIRDNDTLSMSYHGTPHAHMTFPIQPVTFDTPSSPQPANSTTYRQRTIEVNVNNTNNWFYVEDIPGEGSTEFSIYGTCCNLISFNAQDGGGGTRYASAGLLGGGGGGGHRTITTTGDCRITVLANAGCAGGSGSLCISTPTPSPSPSASTPGTPGVVIIYW